MRIWIYDKHGWPCIVSEGERHRYEPRPLVGEFETEEEAMALVEVMLAKARKAARAGQATGQQASGRPS